MISIFLAAWAVIGWYAVYATTPKWMFDKNKLFMFYGLFIGVVSGPMNLFMFLAKMRRGDK